MNENLNETPIVVVIATSGRAPLLERTLKSLSACQRPDGYNGTVVIENGPRAGSDEIVREFERTLGARYLYLSQGNKSAALNKALEAIDGEPLLLFADDDVRFDPGTLVSYAAAARGINGGYFFGGPTGVDYEQEPPEWLRKSFPASARGWVPSQADLRSEDLSFLGFNWAAYAADLRAAGGFDPRRGPGASTGSTGQEGEMQDRLRRAGVRPKYIPAAFVWHYVPRERSTPQWAVDRAYRHGISFAMQSSAGHPALFGCPPWLLARLVKGAVRRMLALVCPAPEYRLNARTRWSYNRGMVRGFRCQGAALATARRVGGGHETRMH